MSCSAKQAPPLPWKDFTAPVAALAAAAGTVLAAAAGAVGAALCARATEETELSTDWAAVAVRPALVRPRTNPRRDNEWLRYFATSSRMEVCPESRGLFHWVRYFGDAAGLTFGP